MTAAEYFFDAVVTTRRPLATAIGIAELPTDELPPKIIAWPVGCTPLQGKGSARKSD